MSWTIVNPKDLNPVGMVHLFAIVEYGMPQNEVIVFKLGQFHPEAEIEMGRAKAEVLALYPDARFEQNSSGTTEALFV